MARVRDFNISTFDSYHSLQLQVALEPGSRLEGLVWQFTIFIPRWLRTQNTNEVIFGARDKHLLEELLQRDFGGFTSSISDFLGVGRRGTELETNIHFQILVLASQWEGTTEYFRALRKELEDCSGEEQVLILRQELFVV